MKETAADRKYSREIEEKPKNPMEQIKSVVSFSRQGEIENISEKDKEEVKDIQGEKGEINE